METKFTKGKWELLHNENWCEIRIENPLKSLCAINKNVYEHKANALLISKAPEMFEMLEGILQRREVCFEDLIEIEQLLKEATEL